MIRLANTSAAYRTVETIALTRAEIILNP